MKKEKILNFIDVATDFIIAIFIFAGAIWMPIIVELLQLNYGG